MSHKIYRVPLNFRHPLGEIWTGYINPYEDEAITCPACQGTTRSPLAEFLTQLWFGSDLALLAARIADLPVPETARQALSALHHHVYGASLLTPHRQGWQYYLDDLDIRALIQAGRLDENPTHHDIEAYLTRPFGPDMVDRMIVIDARCESLGLSPACETCEELGKVWSDPAIKRAYQGWTLQEPPVGEGWQLWETISPGSPVSPVFSVREDLAAWMTESLGYTEIEAQAALNLTNLPTFVLDPEMGLSDGIQDAPRIPVGEAPNTDDILSWLNAHREPPKLLLIHYEEGIPHSAITLQNGQHVVWTFCFSRWRARLFRTARIYSDPAPLIPQPNDWIASEAPLLRPAESPFDPAQVTFAPERLWQNSDEAPHGCYWHGPLASWIDTPDDPNDSLLVWHQQHLSDTMGTNSS